MGKKNSGESKKGKPRSAGSRQGKIAYYWANSWPRNIAKRAFKLYKRERNFYRRGCIYKLITDPQLKEEINDNAISRAHAMALNCIRNRKPNSGFDMRALAETFYLKLYNADNS